MRESLPKKLCSDIVGLYRAGCSQCEIALSLGTAQSNVSRILARARASDTAIPRRVASKGMETMVFAVSQLGSRRHPVNIDFL